MSTHPARHSGETSLRVTALLPVLLGLSLVTSWHETDVAVARAYYLLATATVTAVRDGPFAGVEQDASSPDRVGSFYDLCPTDPCTVVDPESGYTRYFDGDHLSAHGNRILLPAFRDTLEAVWILP